MAPLSDLQLLAATSVQQVMVGRLLALRRMVVSWWAQQWMVGVLRWLAVSWWAQWWQDSLMVAAVQKLDWQTAEPWWALW